MTSLDFAALLREERRRHGGEAAAPPRALLTPRTALDLEAHRVGADAGLADCFYVPDFLSPQEADGLQAAARAAGGGGDEAPSGWAQLPGRRLLNLGGVPHASGMFAEPLPSFAAALAGVLVEVGAFEREATPDQFLVNEYFGSQGIDPHRDGPLYCSKAAIVSLGSPALLHFFEAAGAAPQDKGDPGQGAFVSEGRLLRRVASVALEPNSLLVFGGRAYEELWHGIASDVQREELDGLCVNRDRVRLEGPWRRGDRMSFTVRKAAQVVERPATAEGEAEARRRHAHWMRAVSDQRRDGGRAKECPQASARSGGAFLLRGRASAGA